MTTCGTHVLSHSEKTSRHEMYTENIEPIAALPVCNSILGLLMGPLDKILSPVLPGIEFEFMRTTLGPRADGGMFLPFTRSPRIRIIP
jgi:hypothetical protein